MSEEKDLIFREVQAFGSSLRALLVVLTNRKKLLIGSQGPDELVAAIDKMLKQN